jgi:hypothetical protein
MRRLLLAAGSVLALASAGSAQSLPPDDTLSPAEILSALSKPLPRAETPQSRPGGKPDATKGSAADAKPNAKPNVAKEAKPAAKATVAKGDADGLEQCLRDWDAATHMTRREWSRTCQRVVANRARFQREQQGK